MATIWELMDERARAAVSEALGRRRLELRADREAGRARALELRRLDLERRAERAAKIAGRVVEAQALAAGEGVSA